MFFEMDLYGGLFVSLVDLLDMKDFLGLITKSMKDL